MTDVERFVRFCESEFGTRVMNREATYLKQFVHTNDTILDVGAGIGAIEERLSKYEIVGLDRSKEMIRTAQLRGASPFLVGDARRLPVARQATDAVFFVATLTFIPEVEIALDEAVRVLNPEGILVALLLNTDSRYVQGELAREDTYFQNMVHRDSQALADNLDDYFDSHREYLLGISGNNVFETDDPTEAAVLSVYGQPRTEYLPGHDEE